MLPRALAAESARGERRLDTRRLVLFFTLAIAISWAAWALPLGPNFGPLIAAVVVAATAGRAGLRDLLVRVGRWRVGWRWWLSALSPGGLLLLILAALWSVGLDLPGPSDFPLAGDHMVGLLVAMGIWLVAALGEEVGWRGYALPQLQRRFSPLTATLILAPLWWLWHFEFFVTESTLGLRDPVLYVAFVIYLVEVTSVAIVLTWLYNRSAGSLLLVIVWHAAYNFASVPGTVGSLISILVIVQSLVLVLLDTRARHRGRTSVLGGPHAQRGFTKEPLP